LTALAKAKLTPDEHDDALAQMLVERAQNDKEFYDSIAEALEKVKPPMPGMPGGK
jgi:hypothetical protein